MIKQLPFLFRVERKIARSEPRLLQCQIQYQVYLWSLTCQNRIYVIQNA